LKYADRGAMTKVMMEYTNDYFLDYNNYWNAGDPKHLTTNPRGLTNGFYRVDGVSTVEDAAGQTHEAKALDGSDAN